MSLPNNAILVVSVDHNDDGARRMVLELLRATEPSAPIIIVSDPPRDLIEVPRVRHVNIHVGMLRPRLEFARILATAMSRVELFSKAGLVIEEAPPPTLALEAMDLKFDFDDLLIEADPKRRQPFWHKFAERKQSHARIASLAHNQLRPERFGAKKGRF